MRLVLVHGMGQGRKSSDVLRAAWMASLNDGLARQGLPPVADMVEIGVPFYGAELDRLVAQRPEGVARGDGDPTNDVEAELLLSLVARAGVGDDAIAAEVEEAYVERGPQNWPWVKAAARALAKHAPWLADVVLPLVKEAAVYLTRADATKVVDDVVAPELERGPAVVVGHSLGSVVTYAVLHALGDRADVQLYVTVGSPLGIPVVKKHLPRPLGMPGGVGTWLNGTDVRDPVALYERLDRDAFPATIENVSDVHNPHDDPHGIAGYLRDATLSRRIAEVLA